MTTLQEFQKIASDIFLYPEAPVRTSISGATYIKMPRVSKYVSERHSVVIDPKKDQNHGSLRYESLCGAVLVSLKCDFIEGVVAEVCLEDLHLDHQVDDKVQEAFDKINGMGLEDGIRAFSLALTLARQRQGNEGRSIYFLEEGLMRLLK